MKTIQQEVTTNFHAIELADAITLAPLMYNLRNAIIDNKKRDIYTSLDEETKKQYQGEYGATLNIWENLEQIYDVLIKLGFIPSDGNSAIPEVTIDNLCKK